LNHLSLSGSQSVLDIAAIYFNRDVNQFFVLSEQALVKLRRFWFVSNEGNDCCKLVRSNLPDSRKPRRADVQHLFQKAGCDNELLRALF
jgi:hypothetical protein